MFGFLKKLKAKRETEKRLEIVRRLQEISCLEDPQSKAASLANLIETVDLSSYIKATQLSVLMIQDPRVYLEATDILITRKLGKL